MLASERRVRKLRLHAGDDSIVGPAVTLLEEAFRTASLPGLPRHRLVLVRYLDLGQLAIEASPAAAALLIDAELRRLANTATCAEDYEVDDADTVWFRDALQPYVTLARLLASGGRPRAWYWRSAAPGWRAATDTGASIVAAIKAAAGTVAGIGGAGRVASSLLEAGRLEVALQSLTAADAAALLSASPLCPRLADSPAADDDSGAPRLRAPWRDVIAAWIRHWGPEDPRSACLVALALASELPTLAASRHALPAMRRLIAAACDSAETPPQPMQRTGRRRRPAGDRRTGNRSQVARSESALNPLAAGRSAVAHHAAVSVAGADAQQSTATTKRDDSREAASARDAPRRLRPTVATARAADGASVGEHDSAIEVAPAATRIRDLDGLQRTDGAGLALLVPVLEQIGIAEIVDAHEALAALSLPARVLRRVAERCDLAADDPACAMLPALPEGPVDASIDFVAPQAWRRLRTSRRSASTAAVYHRALDPGTSADLRRIENATLLIAARYLWRHARLGLRSLVLRPGRVAVTPTWVDVAFDAANADIRIRRAGIDIDPGWVAWLGKVIQFHYRDAGEPGHEC